MSDGTSAQAGEPAVATAAPEDGGKTSPEIRDLLDDARLVARHGRRCGWFNDGALFVAIQNARAKGDALDWSDTETTELQLALNNALKLIRPITLVDLRDNWDPFDLSGASPAQRTEWAKLALVGFAICLIFLCVYYTSWYKRASNAVEELATLREETQTTLVDDIFTRISLLDDSEDGVGTADADGLSRIALREKVDRSRYVDDRMAEYQRVFKDIEIRYSFLKPTLYRLSSLMAPTPSATLPYNVSYSSCRESQPVQRIERHAGEAGPPAAASPLAASVSPSLPPAKVSPDAAAVRSVSSGGREGETLARSPPTAIERQLATFETLVVEDDRLKETIRCIIGIRIPSSQDVVGKFDEGWLRTEVENLGTWGLPALYGALGAVIFYLRAFLSPFQRNPKPAHVVLRVALGTFAGIAMAWIWSPDLTKGIVGTELTLGVLAFAFLLGFSIEVFFALLDRLVTLTTSAVNRIGTSAG